jgi:hypothetical protein
MGSGTLDSYPLIADQTNATLGSELVTNGDFENNVIGWNKFKSNATESWNAGGYLEFTKTGNSGRLGSDVSLETNKTYKISVNVISLGGIVNLYVGLSDFETPYAGVSSTPLVVGTNTFYLTFAGSASSKGVYLQSAGTSYFGLTASIDSISVKEVQGNPAIMTNQTSSDIENGSPYANVVQDSDFPTGATAWTISGGNADITNGLLNFTNAASYGTSISNSSSVVSGISYIVQYTISNYSSGSAQIRLGSQFGIERSANGTYTETIVSNGTLIRIYSSSANTTLSIDNVTVEEVNTGLQGYWKMGDGTNDEYPIIYDQTNPTNSAELVTNGGFDTDSDWNGSGSNGWTISGGKASNDGTVGSNNLSQSGILLVDKQYKIEITVSNYVSGSVQVSAGAAPRGTMTANGTYTFYQTCTPSTTFYIIANSFDGSIDNVSVKEVQGNPATMTNMVEGNITNQYPLTKIRNYYRMPISTNKD